MCTAVFVRCNYVKLSEIIPYERNAHQNKDNIPKIAESIREFGFIGQIALESRENPVIVAGHHRVEACKLLGWEELPDENICFCDNLTEDQIKALRLADNRLGEGKWNRSMLREEVRTLDKAGFDMSRFNFDFKSKIKPYGAERLRTDDDYNLQYVSSVNCSGRYDMPVLKAVGFIPTALLGFNYAKTAEDKKQTLHFFIDDYQFERLWSQPAKYLPLIKSYEAVLSPDFSLYMDMPLPMQRWNEYRRRALANYWQRNGVVVIPTLSWTDKRSFGFCFGDLPKQSTVAVSTVGVKRDKSALKVWFDGMSAAMEAIEPSRVILYGGDIGFDFGEIETVSFKANTSFGGKDGR